MSRPQFSRPDPIKVEFQNGDYLSFCKDVKESIVCVYCEDSRTSNGLGFGSDGIDALRAWCEAVLDATKAKVAT